MTKCNCSKCRDREADDPSGAAAGILAGIVFIGLVGGLFAVAQSSPQRPSQQQTQATERGGVWPTSMAPIGSVPIGGGLSIVGE